MWRLDRLNNLSRKICATKPTFKEISEELEGLREGPAYSLKVQCATYAMIAAAFTVFFGGNFRDGFAALFVGAVMRLQLHVFSGMHMKSIFSNVICSLLSGMACILMCYIGVGQNPEMIMIGNIMLLIPGVLLTNSFRDFISGDMITGLLHFTEAMIIAICVAVGFILSKTLLGGLL